MFFRITGKHLLIETEDTTEAGQAGSNDYGYLGGYIPVSYTHLTLPTILLV